MVQLYYLGRIQCSFSQAKVASSIFNTVQSDRLAFMLRITKSKSGCKKFIQALLKNANN